MPLPPSAEWEIDLALSMARLKASTVPMSGFGASFLTATAMATLAMAVLVSATSLPCVTS